MAREEEAKRDVGSDEGSEEEGDSVSEEGDGDPTEGQKMEEDKRMFFHLLQSEYLSSTFSKRTAKNVAQERQPQDEEGETEVERRERRIRKTAESTKAQKAAAKVAHEACLKVKQLAEETEARKQREEEKNQGGRHCARQWRTKRRG